MRRNKTQIVPFLLFLSAVLFAGQIKTIKDALGFSFDVSSPPKRIISLSPNITEILFALGLGNKIVGVTRYCDYPPEALKIEKIGGMVNPNLEKIKALNPDLIISFRGNPLRILKRLKKLGLPLFALEMGRDIESVFPLIKKIGVLTQKEKEAKFLIQSMKKKYYKIQEALLNVEKDPKVFLSLHGMGLWTCGKDSFLDDLVRKAKGVNIAGKIQRKWLHINREQLIHEDPEIIIIISKSQEEFDRAKEWIKKEKPFERLRAVVTDNIYHLDENIATRPGPRFIDALAELARILHPKHFEDKLSK